MTEKRFVLEDEVIIDNNSIADDGGRQLYWTVEYVQRQKLVDLMNTLAEENEQLKEEIRGLNDILARYEEKELESVIKKDKSCGHCKHLQIDGMFGMWCEKKRNWKEVKYCEDFER